MKDKNILQEALKRATYPVVGHGKRDLQILIDTLKDMDGTIESDMYGKGQVIEEFQNKIADYLGKEAAVFFPSGTMAQQIALRIWCDEQGMNKVAYHPLSHLEIHEQDGLKELHKIETLLLADENRIIQLEDVTGMKEDVACLLLELPQREIGGQLPDFHTLEEISKYCSQKGIKLHLDGARLFEVLPYYQKSAAEICALFDSVYVSFYKGIGGIAGAILAGDISFTEKSKIWKRRHGGDLISLYPYIVSADYYFNQRINQMAIYYEGAKELAARFNNCPLVITKPLQPVSNMFHIYFGKSKEVIEPILVEVYEATGVGITGNLIDKNGKCCCEIWIGDRYANIPKDILDAAFQILGQKLQELI
jgi:threonine aldolase